MFTTYLQLGFEHILDWQGYDHMLFIIALCAVYPYSQWRKVVILVTAFTLGHCITLALAAIGFVNFSASVIEFLIPLSILITALYNAFDKKLENNKFKYGLALAFGLLHGLGFSNYFKSLLMKGQSLLSLLFSFNLGVELGQLIIVAVTFIIASLVMGLFKISQREWSLFISGAVSGISLLLILGNL